MGLFSTPQSYLGIDFDTNGVKVVELLNEQGRPRLVTYGYLDIEVEKSNATKEKISYLDTAKWIKAVCKEAKTTTTKVVTALPAFSVFSSILNLPEMPSKDLAAAVKWEAKKIIPMPIQEMILDWKILPAVAGENQTINSNADTAFGYSTNGNEEELRKKGFLKISPETKKKYLKVLLTAAAKDLVKRYIEIFKAANLNLLSLDTEQFALIRSLVGNDRAPLMIVDIGSVVTNVTIVSENVPLLNRSIDIGGLTITKAIASSLNINLGRAEQFKYDVGLSQQVSQGNVPKAIETTLTPIVDELRYSINLFKNQSQRNIEKIILTGGSSLLMNLPGYLTNLLGVRVFLGDPWARVVYPQDLKPILD
ncbi:MAG: pilus assembly protein PilM, partial [Candidatus Buchananbacteria bacterium]